MHRVENGSYLLYKPLLLMANKEMYAYVYSMQLLNIL